MKGLVTLAVEPQGYRDTNSSLHDFHVNAYLLYTKETWNSYDPSHSYIQ